MQNIIYAVIGIILTVATLAMVAPSITGATNGMNTKMIATEIGAIKNTARMWMATSSGDNTYKDIKATSFEKLLPELYSANGSLKSKANTSVTFTVTPDKVTVDNDAIKIEASGLDADSTKAISSLLTGSLGGTSGSSTAPTTTGGTNGKASAIFQ